MNNDSFLNCSLRTLHCFGEEVIPYENRECEEMFRLYELHPDFFSQVLQTDKHWCLDRMEIFSQEDDYEYLTLCKSMIPLDIVQSNVSTSLIIGEPGVGKTCLLYNLWQLSKISYQSNNDNEYPIYASAKEIFIHYKAQNSNDASEPVQFDAMMKAIATAATKELNITSNESIIQEEIYKFLCNKKVFLLIDDLDLIPITKLPSFIQFFKDYSKDNELNLSSSSLNGKVVLSVRNSSFLGISNPFSKITKLLDNVCCIQLFSGFTFNIQTTSQIRSLLQRWPMVENSGNIHWIAFEAGLRAHRTKLFSYNNHSPILLFILARRLAKGSINEIDQGTDREFNIYELMEDLYNDSLRIKYFGYVPAPARSLNNQLDENSNLIPNDNMDDDNNDSSIVGSPENVSEIAEKALEKAKKEFPVLHGYELDIAEIKRFCSLIVFLCHWANPRCLENQNRISKQSYENQISQIEFIHFQLKHLFGKPGIAKLLGFNVGDVLHLSDDEITNIINETFSILSYFYRITIDRRTQVLHPLLQEFMCSKFLTEPSYFYNIISEGLLNNLNYNNSKLVLRKFLWNNSLYHTDWYWDGVLQFSGIRRGVTWLAGKMFQDTIYDQSKQNLRKQQQSKKLKSSKGSGNLSLSSSSSSDTQNFAIFEYFLRNLQSVGVDVEDLGQIRFQILLRVYSSICNHRSSTENTTDPITELIGKAFSGLVERSLTVFIHLEVFPNYFLSAFNPNVCHNIIKRCISIFVKRSTAHAIHLISKFQYSPYFSKNLPSLLDLYTKRDAKSRLAILNILQRIDEVNLEKTNVAEMIHMLGDNDGIVRREVVSTMVNLGVSATQQIQHPLISKLFSNSDPLPVISDAITALSNLIDYSDDQDTSPQHMLHNKHTMTITALLEQADPGSRILGYICFGSPNFKHNANEIDGIPARKAALHVCAKLRSASNPPPIFASSFIQNKGNQEKVIGDYCYTVALNSLITDSLGEIAVAWVSSTMDLLKFKKYLMYQVSALAFISLSEELREKIFNELLEETNYIIHSQTFESLILVDGNEISSCINGIIKYIDNNIIQKTSSSKNIPSFIQKQAMKFYGHICKILPNIVSLQFICDVLISNPPPEVIEEALVALEYVSKNKDHNNDTINDFESLLNVVQSMLNSQMHYISTEGIKAIGRLNPSIINSSRIPLLEIINNGSGSVRQAIVYLVDTLPLLFKDHIKDLCKLFTSNENRRACFIRSSAVGALSCLSRRGLGKEVVDRIVLKKYIDINNPFYIVESAIRVLSLVPPSFITDDAITQIFNVLNHNSNRVTVAAIDAFGFFGDSIINNDERMTQFCRQLAHSDSEIRSATINALDRLKSRVNEESLLNLSNNNNVDSLFKEFVLNGEQYYQRSAASYLFKFYGTNSMIKHHEILSKLILDPVCCVKLEILRILRDYIGNQELFQLLRPSFVELMDHKGARSGGDSQVLREVYRVLRCDKTVANETSSFAQKSLNLYFEDVNVKKQAVLLLASVDKLGNEDVQSLVDMIKTKDPKILTEVTNVFARAGAPFVRLIPKMFVYLKNEHITVKRRLLRFIPLFIDEVTDDYVQLYRNIIDMSTDSDSVVRKKAAELLKNVACALPSDLEIGLKNNVLTSIIDALVELNIDKNSYVRREASVSLSDIGSAIPDTIPIIHRKILKTDDDPFTNILIWRLFSFRWGKLIEKKIL